MTSQITDDGVSNELLLFRSFLQTTQKCKSVWAARPSLLRGQYRSSSAASAEYSTHPLNETSFRALSSLMLMLFHSHRHVDKPVAPDRLRSLLRCRLLGALTAFLNPSFVFSLLEPLPRSQTLPSLLVEFPVVTDGLFYTDFAFSPHVILRYLYLPPHIQLPSVKLSTTIFSRL